MKKLYKSLILFFAFLLSKNIALSQSYISPKYSVDGTVRALASRGDTLIVGGTFGNVGIYTGGGALISTTSDKPNLNFPKLIGNVSVSASDGNGGYYIYGDYRKEFEKSSNGNKIEHILPDFTFERGFSLKVDALFGVNQLLFHNGILYIGGSYIDKIGGQVAGDLTAIEVKTQKVLSWVPKITRTYLGGVKYLKINKNTLYFSGGFTDVGTEKRNSIAAIEINTGKVKSWNPTVGSINALEFYNDKIIIGGGFSDANFENHACAFVDTLTGQNLQYILNRNNLYWAAGVSKMSISGDTLFTFSGGTFDTRVTAINLKDSNKFLWLKYFNMIASPTGMFVSNGSVYVGGNYFDIVYKTNLVNDEKNKEKDIKGIVALDTKTGELKNWFPAPSNTISTMTLQGNNIFIGGNFTHLNVLERNCLVMIDTKKDEILPLNVKLEYSGITSLKIFNNTLYAGGNFLNINKQNREASVIAFDINSNQLLPWNVPNIGTVSAIEANEKYVFIGGSFTENTGLKRSNLLAIDRTTGSFTNWSPNPNRGVLTLEVDKNNLYVGGDFTTISGQNRNYLSSFDLNTLNLSSWNPNPNGSISALYSSENTIWAGGSFSRFGATNVKLFAGLDPITGALSYKPTFLQANGTINSIFVKGRYAMIGGEFTLNNSGSCGNFIMYDLLAKNTIPPINLCQDFSFSDFRGSRVFSLAMINDNLYLAGTFLQVNKKANASNLGIIQYPKNFYEPKIDDYFPKSGGNGGDVTVNFFGDLIQQGMKVKLVSAGFPDIVVPDSMITFSKDYEMKVRFDLRNKTIADYNIIITIENKQFVFEKGFKVLKFEPPVINTQIVGPSTLRTGRATTYNIILSNRGNADAKAIPLWFVTSSNLKSDIILPFVNNKFMPLDSIPVSDIDTLDGKPFKGKLYILLIPQIKAKEVLSFQVKITSQGGNFRIFAYSGDPLMSSPVDRNSLECVLELVKAVGQDYIQEVGNDFQKSLSNCVVGLGNTINDLVGKAIKKEGGTGWTAASMTWASLEWAIDCGTTFVPAGRGWRMAKTFGEKAWYAWEKYKKGKTAYELYDKCSKLIPEDSTGSEQKGETINSFDPNDKVGVGINAKHYITGKEPMQYGIRFENFATATAAAQYVKVIDTLDRSKVDLSTFQLNFFSFGSRIINVSPGQKKRTEFVDLRPQKNLILKIQANLNDTTGIFITEFTSLDPRTMKLTEDAVLGFLPPNKTTPEGEGGIYYTVKAKADLANKTEIKNRAYIYFDENAVIPTPIWSNTIDILAPDTKVESLPEITSDTTFTVRWGGKDGESGIKTYDIYYSTNSKAYKPLMLNTSDISYKFTGKADSTYLFYSVARDSVKNVEVAPNSFDTKTTIRRILAVAAPQDDEFNIFPNPTKNTIFIEPKKGLKINKISLFDMTGKSIEIKTETLGDGKYQLNVRNIAFGVHLLHIHTKDGVTIRKVIFE